MENLIEEKFEFWFRVLNRNYETVLSVEDRSNQCSISVKSLLISLPKCCSTGPAKTSFTLPKTFSPPSKTSTAVPSKTPTALSSEDSVNIDILNRSTEACPNKSEESSDDSLPQSDIEANQLGKNPLPIYAKIRRQNGKTVMEFTDAIVFPKDLMTIWKEKVHNVFITFSGASNLLNLLHYVKLCLTFIFQARWKSRQLKPAEKALPPPLRSARSNLYTKNQLKVFFGLKLFCRKVALYFDRTVDKALRPVIYESVYIFVKKFNLNLQWSARADSFVGMRVSAQAVFVCFTLACPPASCIVNCDSYHVTFFSTNR